MPHDANDVLREPDGEARLREQADRAAMRSAERAEAAARSKTKGTAAPKAAKPEAEGDDAEHESLIAELAAMSPLKFQRKREAAAKEIGVKLGVLDTLVKEARKTNAAGRTHPAHWEVEPWPEPVDGATLLDAVEGIFRRYAVLPEHSHVALVLWVAFAWAHDCFQCSPFATLVSPTKRCGKTRVLTILKWLTPRSLLTGSITAAVVFRIIEQECPTLLIDEADRTASDNEELQGILNASHKRASATVPRCEGDDHQVRWFSTWAPKAYATIAKLPDTLRDRSIVIDMRRLLPSERTEPWYEDDDGEFADLRRKLLRWTEDQAAALKGAFPQDMPAGLDDRAADNWRPLLAIAEAAGGSWPARARAAAVVLSGGREDDDPLVRLLADIHAIFADLPNTDWLPSAGLAERLGRLEHWSEWSRGKPISPAAIARLLKRASIFPTRRTSSNGYTRTAFEDAWTRYPPGRELKVP